MKNGLDDYLLKKITHTPKMLAVLLECFFGIKVKAEEIIYHNVELGKDQKDLKAGIVDLLFQVKEDIYILENQVRKFEHLQERTLYYLSRVYIGTIKKGNQYKGIPRVHLLLITPYQVSGKGEKQKYLLWNEEKDHIYSKHIQVHTFNTSEVKGKEALRLSELLTTSDPNVIDQYTKDQKIGEIAKMIKEFNYEEYLEKVAEEVAELDRNTLLHEAREEGRTEGLQLGKREGIKLGIDEGIKEGRKEGINEGIELGKIEERKTIIEKMIRNNMPRELILELIGEEFNKDPYIY